MDIQMRALVGRRIHASAASSRDRRNLHEHEIGVGLLGQRSECVHATTYPESEPGWWCEWCALALVAADGLLFSVPCQGQW